MKDNVMTRYFRNSTFLEGVSLEKLEEFLNHSQLMSSIF